jgi:hypothetical protein
VDKLTYTLCALTSAACAFLLLRRYATTRFRLLLWSGLCFTVLTLNNVMLVLDRIVFVGSPEIDLATIRLMTALLAVLLLLVGLIVEGSS